MSIATDEAAQKYPAPTDARDRIDSSYTEFTLCKACAGEVLDFVQDKAVTGDERGY